MQGLAHTVASRLAAALVALALGGVLPLFEAPHAEAGHRCQCPRGAGHHDCDCPLCQAEAARVASTPGARVPPCHLALARKALADEREAAGRRAASGPTLASACGDGDHRFDPPPSVPSFTMPVAPAVSVHLTVTALAERSAARLGGPVEPATPPPKLA
jgi:hypothetical protein